MKKFLFYMIDRFLSSSSPILIYIIFNHLSIE